MKPINWIWLIGAIIIFSIFLTVEPAERNPPRNQHEEAALLK